MADYLVIQVSDAAKFPLPNPTDDIRVRIGFNGAAANLVDTRDGKSPGTRRIEIPAGAETAQVSVESPNDTFWPAAVQLKFVKGVSPAQLDGPDALQQRHVTRVIFHKEGSHGITQVEITVGQLKDAEASVLDVTHIGADVFRPMGTATNGINTKNFNYRPYFNSTINGNPAFRTPVSAAFRLIRAPWTRSIPGSDLRSEDIWDERMTCTRRDGASVGRIYLAHRKNVPSQDRGPKLIAIWRPRFVDFRPGKDFRPQGVHVFFHPFIGKDKKWDTADLYDLARRYMFTQKGMVQQHYWTERKVIFVLPVATDDVAWMGDLTTSGPAFDRFVKEVLFFILNMENAARPAMLLQYVDRIAVSGFSYGIRGVTSLLSQIPATCRLREVYSFDGIDPAFPPALQTWLNAHTHDRPYFRVYTQSDDDRLIPSVHGTANPQAGAQTVTVQEAWDPAVRDAHGAPVVRPQKYPVTTREWDAPTRTFLSMPSVSWQGLVTPFAVGHPNDDGTPMNDKQRFWEAVHQYVPEYFTFHAIDYSGFPR